MKNSTWVGMDVHTAAPIRIARFVGASDVAEEWEIPFERKAVRRLAERLAKESGGGEVYCCYEAGPAGFTVKRWMEEVAEGVFCDVVAPSLIPRKPGDKVKTDKRDARKLGRLHRNRDLTAVYPPTLEQEAMRQIVRLRDQARVDLHRARQRLKKFLQLRGLVWKMSAWTAAHDRWLSSLELEWPLDQETVTELRCETQHHASRLARLDERLEQLSKAVAQPELVQWFRCLRGVDTVTAMGIVTTLHNPERFRDASAMMSYVGLTGSEDSSGNRERRGGITKHGDPLLRRLLVEMAKNQARKLVSSPRLKKRQTGQPPEVLALAEKAARRLHQRYWHLIRAGRPHNIATTAVARESVGFIWAMFQLHQRSRQQTH